MLGWLIYQRRLFSLEFRRWNVLRSFRKHYRKARKIPEREKRSEAIDQLHTEQAWETDPIDEEIMWARSRYITAVAEHLFLPTPELGNSSWERGEYTGKYYLTTTAIYQLMVDIRKERTQRSEHLRLWLPALTGLIAVLIGLAAVLLRH